MSINSVEEIINLSESYSNPDRIAYRHLKKQLDYQIRERAVRHSSITFQTPSILFGKPAFDKTSVERRIIKHYSRIGFACYKDPLGNDIVIRWKEEEPDAEEEENGTNSSSSDSESGSMSGNDSSTPKDAGGPDSDSDSDSDEQKNMTKHVVIEEETLAQRLSNLNG